MRYHFLPFFVLLLFTFVSVISVKGQSDSIVFTNSNYMVGEIKTMNKGLIKIETDYSDSDFIIDWDKIKYVKSNQNYIITLSKGTRYNGSFETFGGDPLKIVIHDDDEGDVTVDMMDIVFLKSVDPTFVSRLSLLLSAGFTLTKANNNRQFSGNANLSYLSNTVSFDGYFSMVRGNSQADGVTINTKRTEGGAAFRFFIIKDWFAVISSDLLQSTEQQLNLRAVSKGGFGNFIVNNQEMYFIVSGGAAWNYENYSNPETPDRNSAEAFAGVEYNIFNIGDLKLVTSIYAYPSLTESGRFRSDFNFDIRYEFAFDLFFGVGFTLNYDNKPVEGSPDNDYVLQTNIGWEL